MQKPTLIIIVAAVILVVLNFPKTDARMTIPQLTNALKGPSRTCIAKTGVSLEILAQTRNGQFPPDRELQCYYLCLLMQMKIAKDGKLLLDVMKKQIDLLLPTDKVARSQEVTQICYDASTAEDGCERSWEFTKCYYETDKYIFSRDKNEGMASGLRDFQVVGKTRSRIENNRRKFENGRCKRRRGVPRCTGLVGSRRGQENLANERSIGQIRRQNQQEYNTENVYWNPE